MSLPELKKAAYTFPEAKFHTGFDRAWWYRHEREGRFKLLRVGSRTLIPGEVVEGVLAGKLVPPSGSRAKSANEPKATQRRKSGRPRKVLHPTMAE